MSERSRSVDIFLQIAQLAGGVASNPTGKNFLMQQPGDIPWTTRRFGENMSVISELRMQPARTTVRSWNPGINTRLGITVLVSFTLLVGANLATPLYPQLQQDLALGAMGTTIAFASYVCSLMFSSTSWATGQITSDAAPHWYWPLSSRWWEPLASVVPQACGNCVWDVDCKERAWH